MLIFAVVVFIYAVDLISCGVIHCGFFGCVQEPMSINIAIAISRIFSLPLSLSLQTSSIFFSSVEMKNKRRQ